MTHGTKPEPPAERLRNAVAPLVACLPARGPGGEHRGGTELHSFMVRDLQYIVDKVLGVVLELEASQVVPKTQELRPGFVYRERCPRCGYCFDEYLKQPEPVPDPGQSDAYCHACGALYAGDGYAHQPECPVATESGEPQRRGYVCAVCHRNPVAAEDGYDTCDDCLRRV
jgi:hypothetical protein